MLNHLKIPAIIFILLLSAQESFCFDNDTKSEPTQKNKLQTTENKENKTEKQHGSCFPFFDGFKIELTNSYPNLTHVNHQIDLINNIAKTNLKDWNSKDIFSIDFVLWKDISKYFRADVAVSLSSGSLITDSTGYSNTLNLDTRFKQRYDVLMLWSNFYYYPLKCDYKEFKTNRLIDPFIAVGLGYTFLREETVVRFRTEKLYDRALINWNDKGVGYKLMTGFDINLGKLSKGMERYGLTFTAYKIWNRLNDGYANAHLTDNLKIGNRRINTDVKYKEKMDVDLTGMCYSLALSYRF